MRSQPPWVGLVVHLNQVDRVGVRGNSGVVLRGIGTDDFAVGHVQIGVVFTPGISSPWVALVGMLSAIKQVVINTYRLNGEVR